MDYITKIKSYPAPIVDVKEVMRYSGIGAYDFSMEKLVSECIDEASGCFTYHVCYRMVPITVNGKTIDFGFSKIESRNLAEVLKEFSYAIIFAASVGMGIDRLIKKYSVIKPSKSVVMQAIGAERVESLCDAFCDDIKKEYKIIGKRFSPGYGDLSLDFQRDVFHLLDCHKNIGVSLGENLIMSPSKSVTAIMGVGDKKEQI